MSFISRGFKGRRRDSDADSDRVPPGQYVTDDFPVLSAGPTPHTPLDQWTFAVVDGDERKQWTWEEFQALPSEEVTSTSTASRAGRSSTRPGRASRSTRCWKKPGRRRPTCSPSATAATRRTCRRRTSPVGRRGSRSCTTGSRSTRSTAAPLACSFRISTSGRARSGSAAWRCAKTTSRASGKPTATTCTATRGASSGTGRLTWQVATVEEVVEETPRVRTIVLDVPDWPGHRAGQHLDVRLTAEDGYRAERVLDCLRSGRAGGDHGRAPGRREVSLT